MIKNTGTKIKIGITVLLFFILAVFLYALSFSRPATEDYLVLIAFYTVVIFSVWFGLTTGLVVSLLGVLAYGGHYFYDAYVRQLQIDIGLKEGIWMVLFPIGAAVGGYLGDAVIFVQSLFRRYRPHIESLLMTGQLGVIGNDVTFDQDLKEEISRAHRSLSQFCVALIDVGNLDELERQVGADAAKQTADKIAEALCRNTRDIDKKAKFYGTQFGLILIDSGKSGPIAALDRMRKSLRNATMEYRGRTINTEIEMIVGLAAYPEDGEAPEKLLEKAKKDLEKHRKS